MKKIEAILALQKLEQRGVCVFTKGDLEKLKGELALKQEELKSAEVAKRHAVDIALALRRACFSYVSMESILSEYGVISQIPLRLIPNSG